MTGVSVGRPMTTGGSGNDFRHDGGWSELRSVLSQKLDSVPQVQISCGMERHLWQWGAGGAPGDGVYAREVVTVSWWHGDEFSGLLVARSSGVAVISARLWISGGCESNQTTR